MTDKMAFSRETDLTGVWLGEYRYGAAAIAVPFSAHFIETAGEFVGSTLERATFGSPGLTELFADISGMRGQHSVRFAKVYKPAQGVHRDPIIYAGTVNDALTAIEGDWRIGGTSGRFILTRASRGATSAEAQRASEVEFRR